MPGWRVKAVDAEALARDLEEILPKVIALIEAEEPDPVDDTEPGKALVRTPGGRIGDDSRLGKPGGQQNWVDRAGGLPRYIRIVANALRRRGHSVSRAIAIAVATMKRWARGGGNVSPKVRAAAARALAEWNLKRARGRKDRVWNESLVNRDWHGRFARKPGGGILAAAAAAATRTRAGSTRARTGSRAARTGSRSTSRSSGARKPRHKVPADVVKVIDRYRRHLPKTQEQWRSLVGDYQPRERRVDRRVRELEQELALARDQLDNADKKLREEFRRRRTPIADRESIRKSFLAEHLSKVRLAEKALNAMREKANDPDLKDPVLTEMLDAKFTPRYPKDRNGVPMPPGSLLAHLDNVIAAGSELDMVHRSALRKDPVWLEIRQKLDTEFHVSADTSSMRIMERLEWTRERKRLEIARKRREQEILLDLLKSLRKMGGVRHENAGTTDKSVVARLNRELGSGQTYTARRDWRSRLREAERFFPADWLEVSSKRDLAIVSAGRAYHYDAGRLTADGGVSVLAMQRYEAHSYDGAFRDSIDEANVHELGHRMEHLIPGLRELEFAFVRRRSTNSKRNELEEPVPLAHIYPGSQYRPDELVFKDEWLDAYAGKSYEPMTATGLVKRPTGDHDPASMNWEVFQVGLQDVYGRSSRQFGGQELRHFVLGILATLGRED